MEIILLENVRNVGLLGDKVNVRNGFARNFLIPYNKAIRATKDNLDVFEQRRAGLEKKAQDTLDVAQKRATVFEQIELTIPARASDEGKLFGSVSNREIEDAIKAKGLEIHKSEIVLPNGVMRTIGEFEITLLLHSDVSVNIKITIIPEVV